MLSFYRSSSLVCDPWLVVVGCLQVWASCMSLSPFLFVVFLLKLTSVIKVSQSKVNTEVRARRETQIKIVFLSTRKTSQVSGISSLEMWINFHLMSPPQPHTMIVFMYYAAPGSSFCPFNLTLTSKYWDSEHWALPVKAWNYSDEITLSNLQLFLPQRCDS